MPKRVIETPQEEIGTLARWSMGWDEYTKPYTSMKLSTKNLEQARKRLGKPVIRKCCECGLETNEGCYMPPWDFYCEEHLLKKLAKD